MTDLSSDIDKGHVRGIETLNSLLKCVVVQVLLCKLLTSVLEPISRRINFFLEFDENDMV